MRIVFMGTPEYAVPSLEKLHAMGHDIVGVFTQPDKPSGRGKKILFSPVKQTALKMNVPVFQPVKIRLDGLEDLKALKPDLCVTAAFGQILSREILDIPALGTVNVHASLLPAYRGSSPITWAILNGENMTGVTTMMTDEGIDTGDILLERECPILPEDTTESLTKKLSLVGADLLSETVAALEAGNLPRTAQDHAKATYFPKITREMRLLRFDQDVSRLVNQIRAFDPWPGSVLSLGGEEIKVWKAQALDGPCSLAPGTVEAADAKEGLVIAAGNGRLRITELQAAGGKRMDARDYLRGHRISAGHVDEEQTHG